MNWQLPNFRPGKRRRGEPAFVRRDLRARRLAVESIESRLLLSANPAGSPATDDSLLAVVAAAIDPDLHQQALAEQREIAMRAGPHGRIWQWLVIVDTANFDIQQTLHVAQTGSSDFVSVHVLTSSFPYAAPAFGQINFVAMAPLGDVSVELTEPVAEDPVLPAFEGSEPAEPPVSTGTEEPDEFEPGTSPAVEVDVPTTQLTADPTVTSTDAVGQDDEPEPVADVEPVNVSTPPEPPPSEQVPALGVSATPVTEDELDAEEIEDQPAAPVDEPEDPEDGPEDTPAQTLPGSIVPATLPGGTPVAGGGAPVDVYKPPPKPNQPATAKPASATPIELPPTPATPVVDPVTSTPHTPVVDVPATSPAADLFQPPRPMLSLMESPDDSGEMLVASDGGSALTVHFVDIDRDPGRSSGSLATLLPASMNGAVDTWVTTKPRGSMNTAVTTMDTSTVNRERAPGTPDQLSEVVTSWPPASGSWNPQTLKPATSHGLGGDKPIADRHSQGEPDLALPRDEGAAVADVAWTAVRRFTPHESLVMSSESTSESATVGGLPVERPQLRRLGNVQEDGDDDSLGGEISLVGLLEEDVFVENGPLNKHRGDLARNSRPDRSSETLAAGGELARALAFADVDAEAGFAMASLSDPWRGETPVDGDTMSWTDTDRANPQDVDVDVPHLGFALEQAGVPTGENRDAHEDTPEHGLASGVEGGELAAVDGRRSALRIAPWLTVLALERFTRRQPATDRHGEVRRKLPPR